jgi:TPR repeat protein
MNAIPETKVDFNYYLTGNFPALPLPLPVGVQPRLFNRLPDSDTNASLTSHPNKKDLIPISHTDSRLKIRNDLMKEWQSIENLRTSRRTPQPMTKTSDQNNGILSNATSISENFEVTAKNDELKKYFLAKQLKEVAEVKPTIAAPFHANPKKLFDLGTKYLYGDGVNENKQQAFFFLQKAANEGHPAAQCRLGVMYYRGEGVNQNFALFFYWNEKAAKKNFTTAQFNLGSMYEQGTGVNPDFSKAFEWYEQAARIGNISAQVKIAKMYEQGKGIHPDQYQAYHWYSLAAYSGNSEAQFQIGLKYTLGQIVHKDLTRGALWFEKAANQGHAAAQTELGVIYELGKGVTQDYRQAVMWTEKAARQGDAMAACNLAWFYTNDVVLEKDLSQASVWFIKSGKDDYKPAQKRLIFIFKNGIGINKSLTWATYWLLRYSLSYDRSKLTISLKDSLELLKLIPNTIITFPEFNDVKVVEFTDCPPKAKRKVHQVLIELFNQRLLSPSW